MRTHRFQSLLLLAALVAAPALTAQESPRPTVPQIVTTASGEARVTPDRATISIGVQTRATTAAAASSQNAQKQRAIIDAIRAKGVAQEQISTSSFSVVPETRYDREGRAVPQTLSYLVSNIVTVEVRRIDLVGPVIDAALGAGANRIHALNFGVASPDSSRRVALATAVAKARADAEVMARAAGGSLGPLLELTAGEFFQPPQPMYRMTADAAVANQTPIEPGQESIRATVTARWQYISGAPR